MLGGKDEFWGLIPNRASSFLIRSHSVSANARTAGVISASSSGGIISRSGTNLVPAPTNLPQGNSRGVNSYILIALIGRTFGRSNSEYARDRSNSTVPLQIAA